MLLSKINKYELVLFIHGRFNLCFKADYLTYTVISAENFIYCKEIKRYVINKYFVQQFIFDNCLQHNIVVKKY